MHQYKTRIRLLAERYSLEIDYDYDGGLRLRADSRSLALSPSSKTEMHCTVTISADVFRFTAQKIFAFDIIQRFSNERPLESYAPKGLPLTIKEYVEEENAGPWVAELRKQLSVGNVDNRTLGGNHYNAEFYNGMLILFDMFTGAPANVVEFGN